MTLRKKKTQHKKRPWHKKDSKIVTFLSSFCFCGNFANFFSHPHILLSPKFARARKIFSPTQNISRAFSPKGNERKKLYQENKHKRGEADNPKKSYRLLFYDQFFRV